MSIPARADRRPNGLQSGAKAGGDVWGGRARAGAPRCAHTSEVSAGKRIPLSRSITECISAGPHKRKGPLCRGPSQFKVAGKGIASARCANGPLRRLRALRATLANAIAFPQLRALTGFDSVHGLHKRKGPLCRGPSQFKVAGKGIEPLTRGFSVLCSTN